MRETMTYIYGHSQPYQTLVYPDRTVEGVRGTERLGILAPHIQPGTSVVEFGCNSGMDGVLSLAKKKISSYWGVDLDQTSVEFGRSVAKAWGVEAQLVHASLFDVKPPKAQTLFLFSIAQRIPVNVIIRQFREVSPSYVFVESHPGVDDATSNLLGDLGGSKEVIGTVPASRENADPRTLYKVTL